MLCSIVTGERREAHEANCPRTLEIWCVTCCDPDEQLPKRERVVGLYTEPTTFYVAQVAFAHKTYTVRQEGLVAAKRLQLGSTVAAINDPIVVQINPGQVAP